MLGSFHIKVGGTVVIAVAAVVFMVLLVLWISRKITRGSLRNTRRMFRRSKGTRLPDYADIAMLSCNERHGNNSSSVLTRSIGSTICSFSVSDNNAVNPKQSPSLLSHACKSDIETLPLPTHCFSNSGMTSRESDLPTDDRSPGPRVSSGMMETSPITDVVHSHVFYDEGRCNAATLTAEALGKCAAPRLKYDELRVHTDIAGISYISTPEKSDILGLDVEESDSGMPTVVGHQDTSEHGLLSPSADKFRVPGFSSIPLSLDAQTANPGIIFTRLQLPSPPPTPSTYSMLSPTTEIVRDSDVSEDVKTWSDVLSFTEYEREDYPIHTRKVFSLKNSLPSPPLTPTMSSTPNTMLPEAEWLSGRTIYDTTLKDTLPNVTSPPEAHGKVSYVQARAKASIPSYHEGTKDLDTGNGDRFSSEEALPPYQCFGFDYETRLALKRATSLLAKPIKPPVSTTRNVLRQVTSARPRPPAAEYKPLLLRKANRSKIKTQKRSTGPNKKSHLGFAVGSTSLTASRDKTGLGTKREVSPHVQVLEMLIENVSEPRTGDIALGAL